MKTSPNQRDCTYIKKGVAYIHSVCYILYNLRIHKYIKAYPDVAYAIQLVISYKPCLLRNVIFPVPNTENIKSLKNALNKF